MPFLHTIFMDSDNLLEVIGLNQAIDGAYLNAATVQATMEDTGGTEIVAVPPISWPITLSYVSGSDGNYRGNLPDTLTLTEGQEVRIVLTADAGTDLKRTWRLNAHVEMSQ